ncbi:hypothetical protein LC613_00415 [Nostoc sphaeroides CHAB 2801]|uniref:Uncharacterized protein n=1 Tax=Nostoc sphaeroides CCNUC1 TaxID=2653204 RepID=A0A5P8W715_9NOSO|nr:hypothetical protein [Nostoc sphaeroides]MCC5626742.1 hypothetical protein [Nostoc sphaeroides CHAB 2801]QFS48372.1 hypothetical protein GXM_05864 [Nostoc sphaeroides CCNUC1]
MTNDKSLIRNIPPLSQEIKFGYPASLGNRRGVFSVTIDIVSNLKEV